MGDIRLLGRTRGGRCVRCHGDLRGQVRTCPECAATWHAGCGRGSSRCPTTGCSGPPPTEATRASPVRLTAPRAVPTRAPSSADLPTDGPRPASAARSGPYLRLLLSAVCGLVLASLAVAFLLWPVVDWASFWHFCSLSGKPPRPTAGPVIASLRAFFTLATALVVALYFGDWLREVPAVLREVSSLLDDTRPTAMRLTVVTNTSGKSTTWSANLVGGGTTLNLSLGGLLPPGWLRKRGSVEEPVLVYGLPPPGPYVLEFPDGALALVHPD